MRLNPFLLRTGGFVDLLDRTNTGTTVWADTAYRSRANEAFMDRHGFETLDDFRGHSLQYFTTHADLVRRQSEARTSAKARAGAQPAASTDGNGRIVHGDHQWRGDDFVEQSDALTRG